MKILILSLMNIYQIQFYKTIFSAKINVVKCLLDIRMQLTIKTNLTSFIEQREKFLFGKRN